MINFPDAPSVGATFSNAGLTWRWDGTKWVAASTTPSQAIGYPGRNWLINPSHEIDQANEAVAIAQSVTNFATKGDGWIVNCNSSAGRVGVIFRQIAAIGSGNSALFTQVNTTTTTIAAGDFVYIYQFLEAIDCYETKWSTTAGKPMTFSAWMYCTAGGTFYASIRKVGGSGARSCVKQFTLAAGTWTPITLTFPGDTLAGVTWPGNNFAFGICLIAGSNWNAAADGVWESNDRMNMAGGTNFLATSGNQFYLTDCKLEIGAAATPFVRPKYGEELIRCMRYYEKSYADGVALATVVNANMEYQYYDTLGGGGQTWNYARFKVQKRVVPTLTVYSPATGAAGMVRDFTGAVDRAWSNSMSGVNSFNWTSGAVGTPPYQEGIHWVADARF